jgi:genome maintenance exonuclease 1
MKKFDLQLLEPLNLKQVTLEDSRYYENDEGDKLTSVTTALGVLSEKRIAEWKNKVGKKEANKVGGLAARKGTALHNVAEKYVLNDSSWQKSNFVTLATFKKIRPFLDQYVDEVYGVELQLYSKELMAAGTSDLIAKYRKKNSVMDYKTSSVVKTVDMIVPYFIQSASYAIMIEEHYDLKIEQIVILMAVHQDEPIEFIESAKYWKKKARQFFKHYHAGLLTG